MSEECGWDPNWWQLPKATSLERKKRQLKAPSEAKPGDAFLIVTEGVVTEPIYFDLLIKELQLPAVRINIQPGEHSDPRHVVRTADRLAKKQKRDAKKGCLGIDQPSKFDHVWAVVDTDVAVRQGFWNEVKQLAASLGVSLANSTPCFEFWLLLHIIGFTTRSDLVDGTTAKKIVKYELGVDYSTNKETAKVAIKSFIANWPGVVIHAERVRVYHQNAATQEPANPSTEVCRLVRALNDSALPFQRKFLP